MKVHCSKKSSRNTVEEFKGKNSKKKTKGATPGSRHAREILIDAGPRSSGPRTRLVILSISALSLSVSWLSLSFLSLKHRASRETPLRPVDISLPSSSCDLNSKSHGRSTRNRHINDLFRESHRTNCDRPAVS